MVETTTANGQLFDVEALFRNGYLSRYAKLKIQTYDVDAGKEIDEVYLNSHRLGTLGGSDKAWSENIYTVPIEWVKFGVNSRGINVPGDNTLTIHIDKINNPDERWCTSVDWVSLDFDAIAPIFLVHGVNSDSDTWEPEITKYLAAARIPFSNDISLVANGPIAENGKLLAERVEQLATALGAKSCHLVAHSKGGNDSRAFLTSHYNPGNVAVRSLFTLSTPFYGSVIGDVVYESRQQAAEGSTNEDIAILLMADFDIARILTPHGAGLESTTTFGMETFNRTIGPLPSGIEFYNFGADADLDDDGAISFDEAAGIVPPIPIFRVALADAMYQVLGHVKTVEVVNRRRTIIIRGEVVTRMSRLMEFTPTATFLENDLAVTTDSAHHAAGVLLGKLNANHGTMKSASVISRILRQITADHPMKDP